MYGAAHRNAREAKRLYLEHFLTRLVPEAKTFQRLHQELFERGSFASCVQNVGRSRCVRTPCVTDDIFDRISEMSESSTKELTKAVNISRNTAW